MKKSTNRIQELRNARGLSRAAVAKIAETSQQQIEKLEKGTRRLTTDWMERIAPALGCQPYELMSRQIADNLPANKSFDGALANRSGIAPLKVYRREVPLLKWAHASKFRSGETDLVEETVLVETDRDGLFALRVSGDSMNQIAEDGSTLLVDPNDKDLVDTKCYIFENGEQETTFKRYRSSGGKVRLEPFSYNDSFDPICPKGQIKVVGRVVKVISERDI